MGKQGPCYHCGVTSTPLWRNGPPEKPVLCNACGSRWRTKGTLANYTPLHARADPNDYVDKRVSRVKSISMNMHKGLKLIKRKLIHDNEVVAPPDYNQGYQKTLDEDMSNRSSSGSAISNSESCVQFGSADASELTGPGQSIVWDTMVPSKKRTCVNCPKPSPVEKLTKDLYTILHEQQSSCFSESSENDLLFESDTPMVSVEIGHGSVLIRHPSSIARDEESEASSLSVENKHYPTNEAYSHSVSHHLHNENKSVNRACPMIEKEKNIIGQGLQQEQLKRDRYQDEKAQVLGSRNSLLCNVDLNDVLNFEEFARRLTNEEQQQLLQYLPPLDTAKLPNSLKSMFDSPQFKEDISCYQQLLAEGFFDLSFSGDNSDDCMTLKDFAKTKWVEHYHRLKTCKKDIVKSSVARGPNDATPNNLSGVKRPRDHQSPKVPETRTMKSPKRIVMKATYENKELIDNDGSCFSPRSLFVMPPDSSSLMLDSLPFVDESSEQDLLLDVPSNGSFLQAELLHPAINFGQPPSTSSSSTCPHLVLPLQCKSMFSQL